MSTSRAVRGLAVESLERRIYLSADPIDLSQWRSQAWRTGSVAEVSDTIVVSANGQSQGGDNVALADSPSQVDGDLYLEFTPQVSYVGNDKVVFEVSNGAGTRVVINFERNSAGNLFSITEQEGYGAPSFVQTITITNNASHRLELNVDETSFTLFVDQLPLATYDRQLAANTYVRLCVRGDKDVARLQLTELGGVFSDYISTAGENENNSSDPADPLNVSLWQRQTWASGQISSTASQITLSANGGANGGDHVALLQSPVIAGDFYLDLTPAVNFAAANADGDKVLVEVGNGTTSRHTVSFVRDGNGDLYTIVETTDPQVTTNQVTITNGQSHRVEVNTADSGFDVFVDETLVASFSQPLVAGAFVRLGLRGDKALSQVSLTGSNGVFTPYTSELTSPEPQVIELFALVTLDAAVVPVVEVASYEASVSELEPTVPPMGEVEAQSFAQRTSWSITSADSILRTGLTYYDANFHVDVYAGDGQYFVEYVSGAVELRVIPSSLPAGQDHPFVPEVTPILRNTTDVGQVAKPVKRTGATFYDPSRGIDVYADQDKYLIEYTDGTIEERNRPSGGYIPRPEDFTIGGSDQSKPMSAFGPSLQVLGLATDYTSPKPSSELYYIGPSYVSSTGELRVAGPGKVFLQDPITQTILLRPVTEGELAMDKPASPSVTIATHSTATITDLFTQAYGRAPTTEEMNYWRQRTDKSGAALLGAMEYASNQSESGSDNTSSVKDVFSFTVDPTTVLSLQPSGDSLADALLATYGDAIYINQTLEELSENTLVVVFYGSNQDKETVNNGISNLVNSLNGKVAHVLDLETGRNPFCNGNYCEGLKDYDDQLQENIDTVRLKLEQVPVQSVIFFGYSWGTQMAYDVTDELRDIRPDVRILGTVYLDGIDEPFGGSLGYVHPASESLLNIYQSRWDWLNGSNVVPAYDTFFHLYPRTGYEDFDHFYNALGSALQMDIDSYLNTITHGNIYDSEMAGLIIEKFILGIIKDAFFN